jgi:hypothetical protein
MSEVNRRRKDLRDGYAIPPISGGFLECFEQAVRAEAIAEESAKGFSSKDKQENVYMLGVAKGRSEAIASTEAKFRELAEKWRKDMKCRGGIPAGWAGKYATSLESILTPCPQSRHDAGESESK